MKALREGGEKRDNTSLAVPPPLHPAVFPNKSSPIRLEEQIFHEVGGGGGIFMAGAPAKQFRIQTIMEKSCKYY